MKITIKGNPVTKKNHSRIVSRGGRTFLIPSKQYVEYEKHFMSEIMRDIPKHPINHPINLKCVYYMQTRRKVDLVNLLSATCDCLVKSGILEDDNSNIVVGHDGSRVYYCKDNSRIEINIEKIEEIV